MSLLEDVFLQDEANEAQELERVIEGNEYDERPRSRSDSDDNSEQENEAEEDKRRIDPASTKTRRVIKNPRFVLNPARLTGPRGIHVIPEHFKDFKFKGKGHEKEDLDLVMKKLEHWAYRLYPKFQFEDCLKKIEILGKKRPVMVNLQKIRSDQFSLEEPIVQKDSSEDEAPQDEFDKLLQQQIDLARATENSKTDKLGSPVRDHVSLILPKATSSPSINDEQKERMMRNRKLAEERRLSRLKNVTNTANNTENISGQYNNANKDDNSKNVITNELTVEVDIGKSRKNNRSNVIDSSDEDVEVMNESIIVDVHNNTKASMNTNNKEDIIVDVHNNTKASMNMNNKEDSNMSDESKNKKDINKTINNDRRNDIPLDNNDKNKIECKENNDNMDLINDENKETSNENVSRSTEQGDKGTINELTSKETLPEKKSNEFGFNEELMDVDFEDF